ncbi:hypothetical protein GW17_00045445, partial [Ensete ventricosum]
RCVAKALEGLAGNVHLLSLDGRGRCEPFRGAFAVPNGQREQETVAVRSPCRLKAASVHVVVTTVSRPNIPRREPRFMCHRLALHAGGAVECTANATLLGLEGNEA